MFSLARREFKLEPELVPPVERLAIFQFLPFDLAGQCGRQMLDDRL